MDQEEWDPASDKFLALPYDDHNVFEGKAAAKAQLQAEVGLEVDPDVPLFGYIGRLEEQKGAWGVMFLWVWVWVGGWGLGWSVFGLGAGLGVEVGGGCRGLGVHRGPGCWGLTRSTEAILFIAPDEPCKAP